MNVIETLPLAVILPAAALVALTLLNIATYMAFRHDKRCAIAGMWRVPEGTLLTLALLGGWPAAKLAQRRLRHKTRKQPFAVLLNLIVLLWISAPLAALFWPWLAPLRRLAIGA
ncbi:DUF1294 domain-containing protein [Roseovarius aquimarinus]|uniref:DUF1294 domain-containing protein n=1 Tax=Roseovarius aquimarinus TaxID=1229156 RepID=A0ABW7I5L6_9RHOB